MPRLKRAWWLNLHTSAVCYSGCQRSTSMHTLLAPQLHESGKDRSEPTCFVA
jgi:hypothetical protein